TIIGLETATSGTVHFRDQQISGLSTAGMRPYRSSIQLIFQDPYSALNARMTVLDIISEGLIYHGLIKESAEADVRYWLQEVGLDPNSLHRYPHEFSGGQRQRICIARAISVKPKFIICDEAVSALDVSVQAQVINLLQELADKHDLSYLFISHDLSVVQHISDRIAVMYLGKIVELGPTESIIKNPQHPYTKALISAIPIPGVEQDERTILEGEVPSPSNPPSGCSFHTRCPLAQDKCKTDTPALETKDGRDVSCHFV
ncbi:MAG: ATP-binding cassette domain-containing protein, partial [Lentisphaeria bacterium]|nr:ATP-binding cassette domain-containing protein [Lentisphaeria bacterium]